MRLPKEIVEPAVNVWAIGLFLTFAGAVLTLGVWLLTVYLGAPALSSLAIALGVGVLVGLAIGIVLRWLTT